MNKILLNCNQHSVLGMLTFGFIFKTPDCRTMKITITPKATISRSFGRR